MREALATIQAMARATRIAAATVVACCFASGCLSEPLPRAAIDPGLDAAVDREPRSVSARMARAKALMSNMEWILAIRDFAVALEEDPTNADALVGRAHARIHNGELGDARSDLLAALSLDPELPTKSLWAAPADHGGLQREGCRVQLADAAERFGARDPAGKWLGGVVSASK